MHFFEETVVNEDAEKYLIDKNEKEDLGKNFIIVNFYII